MPEGIDPSIFSATNLESSSASELSKQISEKAARTNKKVILELGGHNPMIVLDDADVGAAVSAAVASTFGYSGQVCTATRRIILSEGVRGKFLTHFEESVSKLRVGNPLQVCVVGGEKIDAGFTA